MFFKANGALLDRCTPLTRLSKYLVLLCDLGMLGGEQIF